MMSKPKRNGPTPEELAELHADADQVGLLASGVPAAGETPAEAPGAADKPAAATVRSRERTGLYEWQKCNLEKPGGGVCRSWNTSSRSTVNAPREGTTDVVVTRHRFCHDCQQPFKVVTIVPGPQKPANEKRGDPLTRE